MSRTTLYRTWTPVVGVYSYYDGGRTEQAYTALDFYKSNVQPWKNSNGYATESGFVFEDYNLLYTRKAPEFIQPSDIPDTATDITFAEWYFFVDGKWYLVVGDEDWSNSGRQPKHHKYYGSYTPTTSNPVSEAVGEPTPLPELVTKFENAVNELELVSQYY